MNFELRQYQTELKNEIRDNFSRDVRSVILCSPTGSGKTVTFADICRDTVKNGMKVMICVDRKELIEQAVAKLNEYGLRPAIITGGVKFYDFTANCFVSTVQTLKNRPFPFIDLLVIDEAHKQIFDDVVIKYREKNIFVIGATATPIRKGKGMKQLGNVYQTIVQNVTISQLISDRFLSPARTFGSIINLDGVGQQGGDYKSDQLFDVYDKPFLYDGLIKHWKSIASDRKTIVFNINVEHSKKTMEAFRVAGIDARHIDGTTPKSLREQTLRDFKLGRFQVLCNVDILTTGYDEPSIGCVVVNRRTKSIPLWLQMCGRGSRIFPNKTDFIILDMGGNTTELGHWERERDFSLWHTVRGDGVAPQKQCPQPLIIHSDDMSFREIPRDELDYKQRQKYGCGSFVHASATICDCGFIFPRKERELIDTEIAEIGSSGDTFFAMPEHLNKPYSEMTFDELTQIQQIKGFKKHWILHQMKPTDENLRIFADHMGYKPSWIHFAKKNIFKQEQETETL